MKIIEICGPPCSGKTYIHDFLIKKFERKFISSNLLICEKAHLYLNLNFIDIDISYLFSTSRVRNPLENTIRFSLSMNLDQSSSQSTINYDSENSL